MNGMPDMTRTRDALRAHDRAWDEFYLAVESGESNDALLLRLSEIGALSRACGEALALDTADRNHPDTCRLCLPGIAGSANESIIRKFVRTWEESRPSGPVQGVLL